MSILETVKQGHILHGEGLFELPTVKEVQKNVNKEL